MFGDMSSSLDTSGHPAGPIGPDEHVVGTGSTGRLPYAEVLRQFAGLLGAQLGRESLAEAARSDTGTNDLT